MANPAAYRAATVLGPLDRTVSNVLDYYCVGLIEQFCENCIKRFLFFSPHETFKFVGDKISQI